MSERSDQDLFGVAVIGLHVRVPGASGAREFWDLLREGRDTISYFDRDALHAALPEAEIDAPGYVAARGVLENAEVFDAGFFGIPAYEAEVMDPQQRLFLEGCHAALENAGHTPASCDRQIGVYAGMANNSYFPNHVRANPEALARIGEFQAMLANEKDFLATRVAHRLDLKGPAISLYTGCSTSLVAVCQAFSALMSYQCDMALAGGVTLETPQQRGYLPVEGGIESPDGHCRPFDANAAGTVFSNGLGIVVLRRLEDAIDDGDHILGVIRGTGLNNDGAEKVSFAAPTVAGQAGAISLALGQADLTGADIDYVEAHGTGTQLGDPIEVAGLREAYGTDRATPCWIGSTKSNFGHLLAAAGVVGLIKALLVLQHRAVPPVANLDTPNPQLRLEQSRFALPQSLISLDDAGPLRAGVSSFGIGGTNAHVIVEAWVPQQTPSDDGEHVLILSARSEGQLTTYRDALRAELERADAPPLADVARTLQDGRRHFEWRLAVTARDHDEAVARLAGAEPSRVNEQSAEAPDDAAPSALARAWTQGTAIEWTQVRAPGARRVPLPTYPFAQTRHWLDIPVPARAPEAHRPARRSSAPRPPILPGESATATPGEPVSAAAFVAAAARRWQSATTGRKDSS